MRSNLRLTDSILGKDLPACRVPACPVEEIPMPKRFRLTRRFPVAMTEDGYRRLKRFAGEAGLDEGEALSFLFENFTSVINEDNLTHRLRLFNSELEDRKK